jgi:hypothetical protein
MVVADVVVGVVMLGISFVLTLDSGPGRRALFAFARWRHHRRVGHVHGRMRPADSAARR